MTIEKEIQMISYTEPYAHPMLNTSTDVDSRNALAVMEEAGALFDVYYPPAGYKNYGDDEGEYGPNVVPEIESGKNMGLPFKILLKFFLINYDNFRLETQVSKTLIKSKFYLALPIFD